MKRTAILSVLILLSLSCVTSAQADNCSHPVLIGLMQIDDGTVVGPQTPIYGATGGVVDNTAIGGGGGGAGKAVFSPFSVQKALDATSPDLIKNAANGKNLKKITITINATQTSPAAIIELSDALISSYSVAPTCGLMLESVQFAFGKIRITVNGVTACWDVFANKSC